MDLLERYLQAVGECLPANMKADTLAELRENLLAHTPFEFYLLRFLLGAAEAGFFPGIILYLTYWFPKQEKARAMARFLAATAVSGVIGAPLSNLLLRLDGVAGIVRWLA